MTALFRNQDILETVLLEPDGGSVMLSLVERDPDVVAFVKNGGLGEDLVAGMKRVIQAGVLSLDTGSTRITTRELQEAAKQMQAVAAMPGQVARDLSEAVGRELARLVGDDERPGALATALDAVAADAAESLGTAMEPVLAALVGNGSDALPQLLESRLLETMVRGANAALARLFSDDGTSPLMTHLVHGEKAIAALKLETSAIEQRLRAQIAELSDKVLIQQSQKPTPAEAGKDWEADTLDDIAKVTAILGDAIEPVGNSAGHGRDKAGDHILHVGDGDVDRIRVAVECRTGSRRLTVPLLQQMVVNREAHSGLLLAQSTDALPRDAQAAGFRVYFSERVVVLHYDRGAPTAEQQLVIAVQVARLLAKLDATSGGSLAERDQIRDGIGRIETALNHLRPLRAAVTGIEKETGVVQKHAAALEAEIRRVLIDVAALMAS